MTGTPAVPGIERAPRRPPGATAAFIALLREGLHRRRRDPLIWGSSVGAMSALMAAIWPSIEDQIQTLTDSYPSSLKQAFGIDRLDSVEALIGMLAQFLFTAGPSHAAVHYPQTDYFTYVPMYPAAAYKPPPESSEPVTEKRILDTLPPFERGADQFQNNQIAFYRFDRFGFARTKARLEEG